MNSYEVVIIGGGVSGTALLYTLAKYTSVQRVLLLEKKPFPGEGNSHHLNNSQTLHLGEIETYYSLERVRQIQTAAGLLQGYLAKLPAESQEKIVRTTPKMLLGVGTSEVTELTNRFAQIKSLFPTLQKLTGVEIATVEPMVMNGRNPNQPVIALYNPLGQAVDFGQLAHSFVTESCKFPTVSTRFNTTVTAITTDASGLYHIHTKDSTITAPVVVVDADAHSLWFAKQLGYGLEYALVPMAGTFYTSPALLHGKVYTCQNPKLLFIGVHGDPNIQNPNQNRWGPTVHFWPVLERHNVSSFFKYLYSARLHRWSSWRGFYRILQDTDRLKFFLKNWLYEIPYFGTILFAHSAQKICPTITARTLTRASDQGGMRLQRVNTTTNELEMGERKIIGKNIIFNMTPSPGASVCLHNAIQDTEQIISFLGDSYSFKKNQLLQDLTIN